MKRVALLALLTLGGCSTGDPYQDAQMSAAMLAVSAGAYSYSGSMAAASYQAPRSVFCYPVGRTVMCQ